MRRSLLLPLLLGAASPALPCTTFCVNSGAEKLFGRNYDFGHGDAILFVNKRGMTKRSELPGPAAEWVARHGSVTFNQFGREFPTGGMNERGLVVELMWLDGTRYPQPDERPHLGTLEWIQYQLDTAATVAEALASDRAVRIRGGAPLHYLIADASGDAAAIEFLDGRMVVHRGDDLPVRVLANDTYERSLAHLRQVRAAGRAPSGGSRSVDRFARAAAALASTTQVRGPAAIDQAFAVLDDVAQRNSTRWSIVWDMARLTLHFKTDAHRERRFLRFADADFTCAAPVQMVDANARHAGDLAPRLTAYTHAANLDLVARSYRKTPFLADTPRAEIEIAARHPERGTCAVAPAGH